MKLIKKTKPNLESNLDANANLQTIKGKDEVKALPELDLNQLRNVGIFVPESENEINWTIRIASFIQGLLVLHMVVVQVTAVDYVNHRCCNNVSRFVHCLWSFIILMAVATAFNFLVTLRCLRRDCLVKAARLFQYFSLLVWLVFFFVGVAITLSHDEEVIQFERFLVSFIFACNLSAVAAGTYNASMLNSVGTFKETKKNRSSDGRYGEILVDVLADENKNKAEESDDTSKYDLI